mmetsp:Transcript_8826/g.13207  ORF Transcript_8826/g.13207 Transcript_8826/m.13207 type:complete len:143 (+) Transcript_8826:295-723(+)
MALHPFHMETVPSSWLGGPGIEEFTLAMHPHHHHWRMLVDILDCGDKYCVYCDIPGVTEENIDISFENNILIIKATRQRGDLCGAELCCSERDFGKWNRRVRMPSNADLNNASASVDNGVLCIEFSKLDQPLAGKMIPITKK